MQVDVREQQTDKRKEYIGVIVDDLGNLVAQTRKCHDRREARREASKLTRRVQ